jgi:hypothetical protein
MSKLEQREWHGLLRPSDGNVIVGTLSVDIPSMDMGLLQETFIGSDYFLSHVFIKVDIKHGWQVDIIWNILIVVAADHR